MALHRDDFVEVIATKRKGTIDATSTSPDWWRVRFPEGQDPLFYMCHNESELKLITCPHTSNDEGFSPTNSIM
jgi:hypothetical protein